MKKKAKLSLNYHQISSNTHLNSSPHKMNVSLPHCMLGNFSCFFVVCWYFLKSAFWKNSFRNTVRMSNSLDPDQASDDLSGRIWVQTVCLGYQQTTLVDNELIIHFNNLVSVAEQTGRSNTGSNPKRQVFSWHGSNMIQVYCVDLFVHLM